MANNLIFPIGFDLEQGLKDAMKDGDKALIKMAEALSKNPIVIKVKLDSTTASSGLSGLKKEIAELNRQWNALAPNDRAGVVGAHLREQYRQLADAAAGYTSTLGAAVKLEDRLAAQREKSANAAINAAKKTREYNKELKSQAGYVSRLIKRLTVYASFREVGNFLTNIREVTAQFELQQVSLGAIIQDQQRANQLFAEIKSFALKSPVSIMDLTKYTKQVAAYRIETDKLFDTTKRLADVSVGLGVDMGRLVLAYGQVKAASYLRAAEIRQFTEAGIPMLELLAEKFTQLQGKAVSTGQVMDLVSKRAVKFSMVEDIFKDMTDAGGMFYNMQEKQGNTLFGLWAKLGDAASIMYNEIGNTDTVNNSMKYTIGLLTELMKNWKAVAGTIATIGPLTGIGVLTYKASKKGASIIEDADAESLAMTKARINAEKALTAAQRQGSIEAIQAASATLSKAKSDEVAALAAQKNAKEQGRLALGFKSLAKSFAKGLGIGIVISIIVSLTYKLWEAFTNANKLKNELKDISAETHIDQSRMITNFETLAKKAVQAADGSREQKEALGELQRTYRDIIPQQDLTIEKLRTMKGSYENLTIAIKEYVRQQQLQKGLDAIQQEYGDDLVKQTREFQKRLTNMEFTIDGESVNLMDTQVDRIVSSYIRLVKEGKNAGDALKEAFELEGLEKIDRSFDYLSRQLGLSSIYIGQGVKTAIYFNKGLTKTLINQGREIKSWTASMNQAYDGLYRFADYMTAAKEKIDNHIFESEEGTFAFDKEQAKIQIDAYLEAFDKAIRDSGVQIDLSKYIQISSDGIKQVDWTALKDTLNELDSKWKVPLQNMSAEVQNVYNGFVPQDRTVASLRFALEQISAQTGVSLDELKRHLMNDGESWEDYSKRIRNAIKEYELEVEQMRKANAAFANGEKTGQQKYTKEEIKKVQDNAEALKLMLQYLFSPQGGSSSQSDPRLQNLKEEISLTKKLYNEYKKLERQIGATQAQAKIQEYYANTIADLEKGAKNKYGFSFQLPFTEENLKDNIKQYISYLEKLQKEVGSNFPNIGKEIDETNALLGAIDVDSLERKIEKKLKELADRLSHTKSAKDFYDRVLNLTGDIELASTFSTRVYGGTGTEIKSLIVKQIEDAFQSADNVKIDLSDAINYKTMEVDYAKLRKIYDEYQDHLVEANKDSAKKLIADGEKASEEQMLLWLKDLEKAKTFAEKRIELARYTSNQIAAIEKSNLPEAQKTALKEQYVIREDKEAAKLEYEAFKNSPMYVAMFEKLDTASTAMLENMKKRLIDLKSEWKNLDPTQLKELQARLAEVNNQLAIKNPYRTLINAFKEWRELSKQGTRKEAEQNFINKSNLLDEAEAQLTILTSQEDAAKKLYDTAVKRYGIGSKEAEQAKLQLAFITARVEKQAKDVETSRTSVNQAQELVDKWHALDGQEGEAWGKIDLINQAVVGLANDMKDAFGGFSSAADAQFFDDMVSSFSDLSTGITSIATGNPAKIISGIGKALSGISGLFTAGKIRRANKEIERQQKVLNQLEYTYGRLEKAMEKALGSDYVKNVKEQERNLKAQQDAYLAQARAEQSKGKKEDKAKTEEHLKNAQDIADQIADMQGKIAERMMGTDVASAARQFASAWLEARLSFSNTKTAIEKEFKDMIKNMIIESVAARIVQTFLDPFFDEIEALYKSTGDMDKVLDYALDSVPELATNIGNTLEKWYQGVGHDLNKALGDSENGLTGISRDIASASEESINGLAAGINTQNAYISYVPTIAEHVAAMRIMMEREYSTTLSINDDAAGWTDWQKQAMDNYIAIERNTAETVAECRRIAERCTAMAEDIHRVVVPKGSRGTHGVQVYM